MAGKPGRSGPPGHLHTAKSVLPALNRLRFGKPLPQNLARVAAIADREAEMLAADKGGLDNMTAGERLMLNAWRTARQATLMILNELIERGAVMVKDGQWNLQPGPNAWPPSWARSGRPCSPWGWSGGRKTSAAIS